LPAGHKHCTRATHDLLPCSATQPGGRPAHKAALASLVIELDVFDDRLLDPNRACRALALRTPFSAHRLLTFGKPET
jgi:hypothetical protein